MRDLSLVVPSLFGPLPDVAALPELVALLTLLARCETRDAVGTDAESLMLHFLISIGHRYKFVIPAKAGIQAF